ncbi:general secretion pathway protein GspK [Chondromyces crocatus]|uniref:General secretion pathway protein GspK n=2 Tax=Chondromyces crocatus TaxID=52 RepID=A0A0K1E775_CHOCO|nr:general secretion pathway protein GspK [Chondromyces crocatus]
MVMGAIAVLTVFLTDLQDETTSELSAALADRDALRAEYHARSAVNLGRLVIATEPTIRNSLLPMFLMMGMQSSPQIPVWNYADMLVGPFNDASGAAAFTGIAGIDTAGGKNLGLAGGGRFELKIVDEDSKINVNLAAKGHISFTDQARLAQQLLALFNQNQYRPLFEERDADGQYSDPSTICSAIIDWADDDEQNNGCNPMATTAAAAATGVEDNFYQLIGKGYLRKNAAYDSIEELRMVRGVGDDFWATFIDPDPSNPSKRIMTVWGKPQAAVNVNTANPATLLALVCAYADPTTPLCIDPAQAGQFLMGLSLVQGMLQGAPVFGKGADFVNAISGKGQGGGIGAMVLGALGVQPVTFMPAMETEFKKAVSTESKFFSIYAEGVIPGNKRETRVRIHAVVDITGATALSAAAQEAGVIPMGTSSSLGSSMNPQTHESNVRTDPAGNIVYWRIE